MRFTRLGALQGDVIWKWISYFQRQSYITVILVVHDSNVSQTTYDLRLVNIKSSSRLEKDITFISRPHLAISLPLKSSLNETHRNTSPTIDPSHRLLGYRQKLRVKRILEHGWYHNDTEKR